MYANSIYLLTLIHIVTLFNFYYFNTKIFPCFDIFLMKFLTVKKALVIK